MSIHTAESVTRRHPDKICDQISDAILDECLKQDPMSRVAIETMGGHNAIVLTGEITTSANVNFADVAKSLYRDLTGKEIGVLSNIVKQSPDIAQGVNTGGAGDQGIMVGYACRDNEAYIPQELYLSRELLKPFSTDGKAQVTIKDGKVTDVVLSVQGEDRINLAAYIDEFFTNRGIDYEFSMYCNNTGAFTIGGFDADSGVTGRKIVVDSYGPRVPVGGGAFSGKDPTKVDRSAAYMARYIALNILKENPSANDVLVKIAYVIGKAEPVMATYEVNGLIFDIDQERFDCRPAAIIERFSLRKPIYLQTAANGHFGYKEYPWEQL